MRMRAGQRQRVSRAVFAVAILRSALSLLALMGPFREAAQAQTYAEPAQPQFGWREMWAGADVTKDVWLLYSGVTLAPLSQDVYTDGLRVRMTGGYGRYTATQSSQRASPDCGADTGTNENCTVIAKSKQTYEVSFSYSELLVGYHKRFGALTAKAFVGGSMVDHAKSARNFDARRMGREYGFTGALEFWLNLGDTAWTSLDLSYSTAYDTSAARWRLGWRALPTVSIGPELRFDENDVQLTPGGTCTDAHPTFRGGLFSRYEWFGGELSASAGYARVVRPGSIDALGQRDCNDEQFEPYATINYLTQF